LSVEQFAADSTDKIFSALWKTDNLLPVIPCELYSTITLPLTEACQTSFLEIQSTRRQLAGEPHPHQPVDTSRRRSTEERGHREQQTDCPGDTMNHTSCPPRQRKQPG